MTGPLIGLDWGTTSLRAYRLDAAGAVVERREFEDGITRIADGAFEATLLARVGDWLDAAPGTAVLAAGMIGSRQGWIEAPYLPCPAALDDIARGLIAIETDGPDRRIHVVPGLSCRTASGAPDVIRGEETQLAGLDFDDGAPCAVVMPGTHSKWVRLTGARVEGFATFMTGELFDVLRHHSILGRLMAPGDFAARAFDRGVEAAGTHGDLAHRLFSARSLALFGELPEDEVADYLSGLLVGSEVKNALASVDLDPAAPIRLVGTTDLARRYARAIEHASGRAPRVEPADAAALGLARIAAAAEL